MHPASPCPRSISLINSNGIETGCLFPDEKYITIRKVPSRGYPVIPTNRSIINAIILQGIKEKKNFEFAYPGEDLHCSRSKKK